MSQDMILGYLMNGPALGLSVVRTTCHGSFIIRNNSNPIAHCNVLTGAFGEYIIGIKPAAVSSSISLFAHFKPLSLYRSYSIGASAVMVVVSSNVIWPMSHVTCLFLFI